MFAMMFSLYSLTMAAEGAVDSKRAEKAAHRIFELSDRQSKIDPLSESGQQGSDIEKC